MSFHFSLEKVLHLRENEKQVLDGEYRNAYEDFEKIARTLYHFLQQKERLQDRQTENMEKGTPVHDIQALQDNLERLQGKIDHYEALFQTARQATEEKKVRLQDKSIDVKRYEKLKDLHYDLFRKKEKNMETAQLDEISTMRRSKP